MHFLKWRSNQSWWFKNNKILEVTFCHQLIKTSSLILEPKQTHNPLLTLAYSNVVSVACLPKALLTSFPANGAN